MPLVFGFEKLQRERTDASPSPHRRALKRNGGFVECGAVVRLQGAPWPNEMIMNKDFGRAGPTLSGYRFRATGDDYLLEG